MDLGERRGRAGVIRFIDDLDKSHEASTLSEDPSEVPSQDLIVSHERTQKLDSPPSSPLTTNRDQLDRSTTRDNSGLDSETRINQGSHDQDEGSSRLTKPSAPKAGSQTQASQSKALTNKSLKSQKGKTPKKRSVTSSKRSSQKSPKRAPKKTSRRAPKLKLLISPHKPTYLVGNQLSVRATSDGASNTQIKVTAAPSSLAQLKGNTLTLRGEGTIKVKACLGGACVTRKVIVYHDLFSDFE